MKGVSEGTPKDIVKASNTVVTILKGRSTEPGSLRIYWNGKELTPVYKDEIIIGYKAR